MFDVLWNAFGLFDKFDENLVLLRSYKNKYLFMNSLTISFMGILAALISKNINSGMQTAFFELIAYYSLSFIFISIILTCLSLFQPTRNTLQFLSLYILLDFPLIATLPVALMASTIPYTEIVYTIFAIIMTLVVFYLKVLLFIKFYKLTFSQVLVLYTLPFIILLLIIIPTSLSMVMVVFF